MPSLIDPFYANNYPIIQFTTVTEGERKFDYRTPVSLCAYVMYHMTDLSHNRRSHDQLIANKDQVIKELQEKISTLDQQSGKIVEVIIF